jgi:hypothetical protein
MQDRHRLNQPTPERDASTTPRRLLKACALACLMALPACEEQSSSPTTLPPIEQPAREPVDAEAMPLFVMQTRLFVLVERGRYADALGLLKSLDLGSYVDEALIAGPLGRPQFWGVMEDGLTIPHVQGLDSIKEDAAIQIEEDAWVIPGTSDTPGDDTQRDWQEQATKAARKINELLYTATDTPEE